ncbi:diaminopimelate decarboxylase family protein [Desulfobacula phenolica]|uniref:Diaminopimelate decarboxylase n=1 Tax=Desulfobacula phenolica TaxID=90732 RepID=A0A1H2J8S2_9BACT|nr:decarboxylase [Desulfobacula phenolica]SDU52827.1 diaminopimelate decarboxylase [Desulfobacula phenolica]
MNNNKKYDFTPISKVLLNDFVQGFFERKQVFINAVKNFGSPLYILETDVLKKRANQFRTAFEKKLPRTAFYFAMKSNNLACVSKTLLEQGFGLDVSSGLELEAALRLKAKNIIFSGPGKTNAELELAANNNDRVTVLLDSFGECERLKIISNRKKLQIKVGVRLNNNPEGLWRKFGIMPENLPLVYDNISCHPYLEFKGLQFHSSWNLAPDRQVEFLNVLSDLISKMPDSFRKSCKFIDIGGGYWPPQGEWLLSEQGQMPCINPSSPIDVFAESLAKVIKEKILPLTDSTICFEPGRWICNDAMHILVSVTDKKADDLVITDAGTNAVGWERFETDYFPVLNLTQSHMTERPCHILGSLCTPHDVWGYAYFGKNILEGDILMIPTQGAYTYSLRQEFIKPLPKVLILDKIENPLSLKSFESYCDLLTSEN